jgi:hypothetical protein
MILLPVSWLNFAKACRHPMLIPDDVAHQNEMMSPVVTE